MRTSPSMSVQNPPTARPPASTSISMKPNPNPQQPQQPDDDERLVASSSLMGSSMPISIPVKPDSPERPAQKAAVESFVPPHLLERDGDDFDAVFSPSSMRREQLLRRNEILRSTGFLENKSIFTGPPTASELIDVVKDSMIENERRGQRAGAMHVRASSLTAALGTSA